MVVVIHMFDSTFKIKIILPSSFGSKIVINALWLLLGFLIYTVLYKKTHLKEKLFQEKVFETINCIFHFFEGALSRNFF